MAKKRTKQQKRLVNAEQTTALYAHISRLKLTSLDEYERWCERHGFSTGDRKSASDLKRELNARQTINESNSLARSRITRRPLEAIDKICLGELNAADLPVTDLRDVCTVIERLSSKVKSSASFREFVRIIGIKTDLLVERASWGGTSRLYIDALIAVHRYQHKWLRPLSEWKPTTRNRYRLFSSLVRHLLASYPVPRFFDSVWFDSGNRASRAQGWFVAVGAGKNFRHANPPVPLTKRVVHHLMEAPDDYTVTQAIRWGQIHALGGDKALCEAIIGTRLGANLGHDEFWQSVFRFFVANPLLDRALVGPLIDYIHHQRFEGDVVILEGGIRRTLPPAQPNLSMSGRTALSLTRQMEAWHNRLGRTRSAQADRWQSSGIAPFHMVTGKDEKRVVVRISELLSKAELVREGRTMQHCVASYAYSCARGRCSIWSMTREDALGQVRTVQTIEVNRERVIVQSRGRKNQLPNLGQANIIRQWANLSRLNIFCYGL